MTEPNNSQPVPVLVIDDERDIRDACERLLSRMGCKVSKAGDGQTGLELLAAESPWVVLLDLKMPGIGGMAVLPEIRRRCPEALVIIITGYATVETAIEAMKKGAYDFIPKPFKPDELRITVGRAIERIRLANEARLLKEERRRTLADLSTEKSRTRTIIQALPFGVMVTNGEGQVVLLNPALREMLGLPPDSPPGSPVKEYVDNPAFCDLVGRIGGGGQAPKDPEDWSLEFSPGRERYLWARGSRVLGQDGRCLGAAMVLVDLTEYKMLDRLKDEFVAKVSHELRSPLSTILLQLTVLAGEGRQAISPGGQKMLSRARERTEGLINFVKELLDISRIESGTAFNQAQEVNPADLLTQAVESLLPQAEEKQQKLSLDLPDSVLPSLHADPVALTSVFTNLINNAIKYSDPNTEIKIQAANHNKNLKISITDQGFGMEPDKLDKIWDKFYRINNEKTRYVTGTGLGLPIVKSIIDSLGGSIEVTSTPGHGSTFTVWLEGR
jgi:PAS domain S-box-containing protein